MKRFSGKVAVVTGGASGIGEATARRFIDEGANLVFADWNGDRGRQVAVDLSGSGGTAVFVEADVSDETAAAGVIDRAVSAFGRLDILVNNAGIRLYQNVVEASAESWDKLLGVNLKSYAYCSKAAIPHFKQSGCNIVNVASVRSITAGSKTVQYDTAKAGVAGLTRGMAMDHSPEGVRVNAVCPGPIFTPFHAQRIEAAGQSVEDYNQDAASRTMLQRPGTAEEVAACITFLASDDASYVTGTCLFVDGGMTAM
jgi:meso-butanediol dehydrogenase / (S,S)-butanediol dehydrogenase / diacetyl reductase